MPSTPLLKPEKWQRPWPSRNCAYNIQLRSGEAKYNREKIRVEKESKCLERVYRQNIRKLNAAHRGVISMLGHEPYPNCDRDHVLFEHNQPGFCYRRNGQPRRFHSLLESKTRNIIHDLDGKEGLLSKPASNIISDSPVMAEILSAPEIVEILCELRTTAVLISDPELFAKFSSTLMKSPNNPLPSKGQVPLECLTLYRTNLIQEFFDALRIQMGIRRSTGGASDPSINNYLSTSNGRDNETPNTDNDTDAPVDEIFRHNYYFPLTDKQWNDAVIERLRLQSTMNETETETGSKLDITKSSLLDTFKQFTLTVNPEDNLKVSPSNDFSSSTPTTLVPPANTVADIATAQTATNLGSVSTLELPNSIQPNLPVAKPKRNEFDSFVKKLVSEVENISEVGKNMVQLQKKKPQYDTVASPLVRLLRKKSLFSSLNEDDLLFYEYEGGRRDAANKMARGLNINQPRPGGFTFRVPSRSEIPGAATGAETEEFSYKLLRSKTAVTKGDSAVRPSSVTRSSSKSNKIRSRSASKNRSKDDIFKIEHSKVAAGVKSVKSNVADHHCTCSQHPRSLKRLCCPACTSKLRSRCKEAQERDRRETEATESTWKISGMSNFWTKNSRKDSKPHHLLSSIPLTLKKNYATHPSGPTVPSQTRIDSQLESEYVSQFNFASSTGLGNHERRGAPTPIGRRKNLLPEITRLMSTFVTGSFSRPSVVSKSNPNLSFKPLPLSNTNKLYSYTLSNLNDKIKRFNPVNSKFQASSGSMKEKSRISLGSKSRNINPGRSRRSTSKNNGFNGNIENKTSLTGSKVSDLNSWTLKVDRMDIMKLKHELEVENVRQKMKHFEEDFLNTTDEITNL